MTHAKHQDIKYMYGTLDAALGKVDKALQVQKNQLGFQESFSDFRNRILPAVKELEAKAVKLEQEVKRLKQIEKSVKYKDTYYSEITKKIDDDATLSRVLKEDAEMWQNLKKAMKMHPVKENRLLYKKYIHEALIWAASQDEKNENDSRYEHDHQM